MTDINQRLRCRTCSEVSEDQEYHLLSKYFPEYDKKLSELLLFICHIDDHMKPIRCPTEMCNTCTQQLIDAYNFALQAQRVNNEISVYSNLLHLSSVKHECIELPEEQILEQISSNSLMEIKLEIPNSYDSLKESSINFPVEEFTNTKLKENEISDSDIDTIDPLIVQYNSMKNSDENLSQKNNSKLKDIVKRKLREYGYNDKNNSTKIRNLKKHVKNKNVKSNFISFVSQEESLEVEQFICTICNRGFQRSVNYNQHMLTHCHKDDLIKCYWCKCKFSHQENLDLHMKRRHGIKRSTFQYAKTIIRATTSKNGLKEINCKLCNSSFSTICALRSHLLESHHSNADSMKYYSITNSLGFELHIDDSETDTENDDDNGNIENNFDDSKQKHSYNCEICKITFLRKYKLAKHQLLTHNPEILPLKCEKCIFKTVSHDILEHHKKTQCYNKEKKYECGECFFKFVWKENLKTHQDIIHKTNVDEDTEKLNEVPLECDACLQKFFDLKSFKAHKKKEHLEKLDSQKESLQVDQLICSVCNRKLLNPWSFNQHILSHRNDEDVFKCLWCMRKFSKNKNLNLHMQHCHGIIIGTLEFVKCILYATNKINGPKDINCKLCNSSFLTISALRSHLLELHHANDVSMRCYSITNSLGFELHVEDSETEANADDDNVDGDDNFDANTKEQRFYNCEICNSRYNRKFKLMKHQLVMHNYESIQLKCDRCIFKTVSHDILEHHKKAQCYNKEKKYECNKCFSKFMWKENMESHKNIFHSSYEEELMKCDERQLECDKCHLNFLHIKSLKDHVKKEHTNSIFETFNLEKVSLQSKQYICTVCNRNFQRAVNFNQHMLRHRNKEDLIKCCWCKCKFSHQESLDLHMKRRHRFKGNIFYNAKTIIRATTSKNGLKEINCKLCNSSFSTICALRSHLLESHHSNADSMKYYSITNSLGFELHIDDSETGADDNDDYDDDDDSDGDSGDNVDNIKTRRNNLYKCEVCNITFSRKYKLAKHHHALHNYDSLQLKCDRCIFKTVSQVVLDHHKRSQCYNEEKKFKCDKCLFKFMWEENLNIHKNLLHKIIEVTGKSSICKDNLLECCICQSKYDSKKNLQNHIKEEHPEKCKKISKKLCPICGKSVTDLITHMRRHNGEKPFKCSYCDKGFPHQSALKVHLAVHKIDTPHKCSYCGKGFGIKYSLVKHLRTHTGERPYKCSYCEKAFASAVVLTEHTRIHTGERPYVCRDCGQAFITASLLKKHCNKSKHRYEHTSKPGVPLG